MSNRAETPIQGHQYDHFSDAFYRIWKESPIVMEKARKANDLINTYLRDYGVESVYELPADIQRYVLDNAQIKLLPGEY